MAAGEEESREQHAPHGEHEAQCVEWCPICRTMDVLRASTTPETREQWQRVQREAVVTLRALVEQYAQRIGEPEPAGEPEPPAEPEPDRREQPVRAHQVEEIPPVE
jgi:hypothetical protein